MKKQLAKALTDESAKLVAFLVSKRVVIGHHLLGYQEKRTVEDVLKAVRDLGGLLAAKGFPGTMGDDA